jgi:hypothetical protein
MLSSSTYGRGCRNPVIIPHETAVKTREFIANDIAAWASYQPAYDMIIKREPDLIRLN